jgi:tryptophan synthase beta chain
MLNEFLNLNAYHRSRLFEPVHRNEISLDRLSEVLPPSLARLELSSEKLIHIPEELLDIYASYRPTPLFRAKKFEESLGTTCEIYIKDEGATPTGNHKINSAYLIAYLCKKDGIKAVATETTGNWGIALSMAARQFGIKTVCFMDYESHTERPNRKALMEALGADVVIVEPPPNQEVKDLLTLSANAAIEFTRRSRGTYYIFGSVYNYFIIPQSVIGAEIKSQMADINRYPDIVVGTCGGGANLLGTAGVFLADIIDEGKGTRIVSAESESCPILSEGKMGLYSIDTLNYYPLVQTYGLEALKDGDYVGGLGSTVVASPVAYFHSRGMIEVNKFNSEEAMKAADLFYKSEGKLIALETGFTMAAVVKQARENRNKVIVANISSGETDKRFYECLARDN